MKIIHALYIAAIIGALITIQSVRLILLYHQVARYKTYWQQRAEQSGELMYVALGDSAAQGIGASNPEKGYVGLITNRLASQTGKTVRTINLSVSGAVIEDVITKQLPQLKKTQT